MTTHTPPRRRATPLVWLLASACLPGPNAMTSTEGTDTGTPATTPGDPGTTTGDSTPTTSDPGATTGSVATSADATTDDPPITTGSPDGDTTCEPTTGEPVCSAIPVTPGGDRGCGGEELSIAGCDQLAGYELCPNKAVHRHTADIPCDDADLCSPWFTCRTDEDCGPEMACVCDVTLGDDHRDPTPFSRSRSCVWAECHTDADCAFGMRCGVDTQCGHVIGLHCHTPEDGCEGDADCPELCAYSSREKRWFCVGGSFCE